MLSKLSYKSPSQRKKVPMKTIRIFVDGHVFDDIYQGTTTYIQGLYSALANNENFEITVGAVDIENVKRSLNHPRLKYISLSSHSKFVRLMFDIPKIIRQHRFDYAHFQYIVPPIKGCRFINTIHDLLFLEKPQLFSLKYRLVKGLTFALSCKRSDLICTVSNFSKQSIIKHFGINPDKICVTPNAAQTMNGTFDVRQKYSLEKYILYVSRFEPRKNHYSLHKAFNDLQLYKEGYKLVFIGTRNHELNRQYEKYVESITNEQRAATLFLENIGSHELSGFYQSADLFVYPSIAEGFGIPPLEAAVNDCKVVCSNQTAMADFAFFGKYLIDPNNEEELRGKIRMALSDQEYPAATIRQEVIKIYNWHDIANRFANFLINEHRKIEN
jgi:glycosyltransferase involved in cell wall biosynthesis